MTEPDTAAIRAQMEALAGFTAGPWNADLGETYRVKADGMNIATANFVTLLDRIPTDQVRQNARLIAAAPDMRETILAICDALDAVQTSACPRGEDCDMTLAYMVGRGRKDDDMAVLRAEIERLRLALSDVIGCDHHNFCDGGPPKYVRIARAALAQKWGE